MRPEPLKAAAERLREHSWLKRFRDANYENMFHDQSPQHAREVAGFVDAFIAEVLAMVPADSDEPITDDRLRNLGFKTKRYQGQSVLDLQ